MWMFLISLWNETHPAQSALGAWLGWGLVAALAVAKVTLIKRVYKAEVRRQGRKP